MPVLYPLPYLFITQATLSQNTNNLHRNLSGNLPFHLVMAQVPTQAPPPHIYQHNKIHDEGLHLGYSGLIGML
jgi:hypothetical protein